LSFHSGDGVHVDLYLVDGLVVDGDDVVAFEGFDDPAEEFIGDLVLAAEGVDAEDFLFVLFGVLLGDRIAIQQLIIDVIGVVSFFGLLLFLDCLFNHFHDNFLEVIQSDEISCDHVSIVVVVIFFEEE
jgi:hypothetical protein